MKFHRIKLVLLSLSTLLIIGSLFVLYAFKLPEPPKPMSNDFALTNMIIVNPLISKTKVASLSVNSKTVQINKSNPTHDKALSIYDGYYVLPGLINMHSHSPSKNLLNTSPMFSLAAIMHGITTWRDAIDADGTGVSALRKQITENEWPTPNVFACALITQGKTRWPNSNVIERISEVSNLVKSLSQQGYDCIKSYENLTPPMIAAIKQSAEKFNMQVIGHVPEGVTIEQAWLPDTQHFFGVQENQPQGVLNRNGNWESINQERIQEVADWIIEKKTINTPTLVTLKQLQLYNDYSSNSLNEQLNYVPRYYAETVWHPQRGLPVYRNLEPSVIERAKDALSKKLVLLKALHDRGATLNLGTDTQQPFVVPGIAMWQEMKLFKQAGLTPEEVWAHATWKSRVQLPGQVRGLIENGSEPTFLIFAEDPTQSLDSLNSLRAVVIRGHLYDIAELERAMNTLKSHYESWPVKYLSKFFVEQSMKKIASKFTH